MPVHSLPWESPDQLHTEPAITGAAQLIRAGRLVALPTETVYGLGANALDAAAVARIFELKGRPHFNPLIVHVVDKVAAQKLTTSWPAAADLLAEAFWPGPLTLVLPKAAAVPAIVTAGLDSVALRVPAHPVAQALLAAAGVPIAAPSANRFTEVSPTTAAHVAAAFGDDLYILDGGPCAVGIESTVLDLCTTRPTLLRPGAISIDQLEAVVGPIDDRSGPVAGSAPRRSPGQVERHYAPRARLVIAPPAGAIAVANEHAATGAAVALLSYCGVIAGLRTIQLPADAAGYMRGLYAALHALDDEGIDVIVAQELPAAPQWQGPRDRLRRAGHKG